MSQLTRTKLGLYLAALFVVGAITGGAVGWNLGWNLARERRSKPPTAPSVCQHMKDRLQSRLELTPEQLDKISPILEEASREMDAAHKRTMTDIARIMKNSNQEVLQHLTPAQQAKLAEMDRERDDLFRRRSPRSGTNPPSRFNNPKR